MQRETKVRNSRVCSETRRKNYKLKFENEKTREGEERERKKIRYRTRERERVGQRVRKCEINNDIE